MNNNKGNALNTLHTFYARYNGTRDNGFGTRVKNSGFSAVLSKNGGGVVAPQVGGQG